MSNLLKYISHLMQDDDALHQFTIDPITDAENNHGLTKAERAVLRRTVHGLSNNSVNGYSMVRSDESYRRSLRLLQNVLHSMEYYCINWRLSCRLKNTGEPMYL